MCSISMCVPFCQFCSTTSSAVLQIMLAEQSVRKRGVVSKYMSVHKDIFHLEQKFMYSYTFWIVMRFFYIVVYRRRSHRRRWTFVASSWSFINTIYILFSSTSSIFSHSHCSCFLPAFHKI